MPAIPATKLVQVILDAIQESGYSGAFISASPQRNPREFAIAAPDNTQLLVWVYAWTLTPGGRPQLPHEYRIQMTSAVSPLPLNPRGLTVLMGYEPNLGMFAGFDLNWHRTFTTGSPSVQIDIRKVQQALQDGFAFDRKDNGELAIGVRPDLFLDYILNADNLHKYGQDARTYNILAKASALEEIREEDISRLPTERQRLVTVVNRLSRKANFRQQVLNAYGNRCAVTRTQLRLVDAAHILPVGAPGSVDNVINGLALTPTYHRAYDYGLIYLDENYKMQINPEKEMFLTVAGLDGGMADLKASLGKILLPPDKRQWPNPGFIKKANQFRQIRA